jgi:hypothetical protein
MSLLSDFREFCYSEARALRGLGRSLNINPEADPKTRDILLAKSNGIPVLYVIWQGGSVAEGFSVVTLYMYHEFMNTPHMDDKLSKKLQKNIRHFSPDELGDIQKFDPSWLTKDERNLLDAAGLRVSSMSFGEKVTPIWAFEQDLISRRKETAEKEAEKTRKEEEKKLLSRGIVTHKEPTVSSAERERVEKMLLGDKEEKKPEETPEEKVKKLLGDDASRATDKSVADDAAIIRQRMAQQDMRDRLAARKAAREAGQEVPLSTRRSKPRF